MFQMDTGIQAGNSAREKSNSKTTSPSQTNLESPPVTRCSLGALRMPECRHQERARSATLVDRISKRHTRSQGRRLQPTPAHSSSSMTPQPTPAFGSEDLTE